MQFAQRLVEARKLSGLSQEHVARALNLTRPTYFNLEQGKREPNLDEIRRISELFGIRIDELISGSNLPDKEPVNVSSMTDSHNELDEIKYKNVLLYLLEQVGAKPNVGETVLYKLLYFIETNFYLTYGRPLTHESFYKRQYGPVPTHFREITNKMINGGELDSATGNYFMYMQTKYLPRASYSKDAIEKTEAAVIDQVIENLSDMSATELSDLSHRDFPWIEAANGEIINLELAKKRNNEMKELVGA